MYVARKSNYIQEDIKRNWSSWNFGEDGFEGSYAELNEYLASTTDENPIWISGFEIYPNQVKSFKFGELRNNYWVAIDRINAKNGLSAISLKAASLKDAINEAQCRSDYFGNGISFDASIAILKYSNKDIHIFEIE
jgi:hypothetical protein